MPEIRTPPRTPEPAAPSAYGGVVSSLTEAELRLAPLVAQGASNQEAAAKLYLSVKTVEARLTRIQEAGRPFACQAADGAGSPRTS